MDLGIFGKSVNILAILANTGISKNKKVLKSRKIPDPGYGWIQYVGEVGKKQKKICILNMRFPFLIALLICLHPFPIIPTYISRHGTAEVCSGHGKCVCGKCVCDYISEYEEDTLKRRYSGSYCECNDHECPHSDGWICGGKACIRNSSFPCSGQCSLKIVDCFCFHYCFAKAR